MNYETSDKVNWKLYVSLLALMYVLIYILPLGFRPVMIPDEVRYAEIPREMIISENWVSPHLNGLRYFEKPVMGYWVTAISLEIFGDNAFAMRLPSALSAGLSALAIYILLSGFTSRRSTALNAAMIYLSMLGVFLIGTMNILDSLFSFLLTAAFVSFYLSHKERNPGRRLAYLLSLGGFCGAAFLTKGFLAFVLLGVVIVPFVIWQGRWQELFTRGIIALLAALVVVAPWAILVHLQEPEYWKYFFWEEHIKRFASSEAQHSEPVWFYLTFLPLLTLPWIGVVPIAFKNLVSGKNRGTGSQTEASDLIKFSFLWCLIPFVFFSVSRGKLPTYVLPCLAPLAILLATGLEKYFDRIREYGGGATGYKIANALVAVFFVLVSISIVLLQTGVVGQPVWNDHELWRWLALSIAFLVGAVLLAYTLREQPLVKRTSLQATSIAIIMLVLSMAIPQRTAESKMPGDFLLEHTDLIKPDTILFSDDIMIHAVNWFYRRTDVYMTGAGESRHGLSFEDSRHRLLEGDDLKKFIDDHLGKDEMVVIHHSDADARMQAVLPTRAIEYRWGRFVLWYIPLQAESPRLEP